MHTRRVVDADTIGAGVRDIQQERPGPCLGIHQRRDKITIHLVGNTADGQKFRALHARVGDTVPSPTDSERRQQQTRQNNGDNLSLQGMGGQIIFHITAFRAQRYFMNNPFVRIFRLPRQSDRFRPACLRATV